jgi:HNH endonuclease
MTPANRRSVPAAVGRRVRQQAGNRCGYCLSGETLLGMPMEFDHLIPQAAGGTTHEENLWLACRRCNGFKGTQTHAYDPQRGEQVALFNPRQQAWIDHSSHPPYSSRIAALDGTWPRARDNYTVVPRHPHTSLQPGLDDRHWR